MVILAKKLHIMRNDGVYQTANIYTTTAECPEPNLKVSVDNTNGYIKLGEANDPLATIARVHSNSTNRDYAILSSAYQRDFPSGWGAFQSINFTATLTETSKDWCYAWVLHFANGVLPIRVYKNANEPTRDDGLYISGYWPEVNSIALNYNNSLWEGVIAKDSNVAMKWRDKTNSTTLSMISYTDATLMGFHNGYNTVYDTVFTASVNGNQLNIYKNGNLFKTYNI